MLVASTPPSPLSCDIKNAARYQMFLVEDRHLDLSEGLGASLSWWCSGLDDDGDNDVDDDDN